ncbi:unnamed protein product [Cladocopium goreaui]|uniref:6-phosphofructokinase 7 n=1 Tax=Cladocopium goreaui TaxID=2562237 RepID=A0A9P1C2V1_9DINO|nr:unnamed protein product [Cladocopium goreaui]
MLASTVAWPSSGEYVASLRFQLHDFSQALEELTLLVEEDPGNKEAIRLLELCEIQVAREVREKASSWDQWVAEMETAGFFYSFDWSEGQAEGAEGERAEEQAAQGGVLEGIGRDRGFAQRQRWGLRLRESAVGLEVEDILPGIVKDCNFAVPEAAICVGDKILEVNGVRPSGQSSALAMLAEMSKEVLHLLLAPPGDHFAVPLKDSKRPLKTANRTWTDAVQNELLGFSPPCLCDWLWHEERIATFRKWLWHEERIATFRKWSGDWRAATIQLDGCTWTAEVEDVFSRLKSEERIQFRPGQRSLQSVSDLDMIIVPLILDEEVEDMTELPVQVRSFLLELEDLDMDSLCILVLTAGGNGPECSGARNDGFGMPAAAPLRGMFRCFRLENPEMPILHLDSDALVLKNCGAGGAPRHWEVGTSMASGENFDGAGLLAVFNLFGSKVACSLKDVAYRKQRRFVPKSGESYAKLCKALEAFPKICQEMEVSRLYCTCNRSSRSPCLMAEGVKKLLQGYLRDFEVAANSRCIDLIMKQLQSTYADYRVECMKSNEKAPESLTQFIFRRRDDLCKSVSRAEALFFEVEKHVSSLRSPKMKSDCSWSLISETPKDRGVPVLSTDRLEEVASAASGHSINSEISCLSGQGGPHCFLPSHLFHALQSGVGRESPSAALVLAQDLRKGTKILSADGVTIEVTKVEKQKTNKLVELEIDRAMPLTTTPHHRIMVPSESEATTVMAVDLSPGSLVMCSDCMPKKVIRKTEYLVEEQDVLAITFHPDKAVACFLPPEEPVVLTKGLTPKETRRGGMGRRGVKQEVVSIPDTAAGEYED